jgi:hypothetical protein
MLRHGRRPGASFGRHLPAADAASRRARRDRPSTAAAGYARRNSAGPAVATAVNTAAIATPAAIAATPAAGA